MAKREIKAQDTVKRLVEERERKEARDKKRDFITRRQYKYYKKKDFETGVNTSIGIMEIILLLILVIVVGRILFGSYNNDFTFATFFEELISFEGINIQNWLRPEYSYPEGAPTWLIDFLNWQVGNQNTFALLIGSIVNCGYFIVHILYIIFGI